MKLSPFCAARQAATKHGVSISCAAPSSSSCRPSALATIPGPKPNSSSTAWPGSPKSTFRAALKRFRSSTAGDSGAPLPRCTATLASLPLFFQIAAQKDGHLLVACPCVLDGFLLDELADHQDLHFDGELHDAADALVVEPLGVHLSRNVGLVGHRAGDDSEPVTVLPTVEPAFFDVTEAVAENSLDRTGHVVDRGLHLDFSLQRVVGHLLIDQAPGREPQRVEVEPSTELLIEKGDLPKSRLGAVEVVLDSRRRHGVCRPPAAGLLSEILDIDVKVVSRPVEVSNASRLLIAAPLIKGAGRRIRVQAGGLDADEARPRAPKRTFDRSQ